MSKVEGIVVVNEERCKGCGLCVEACPRQTLTMSQSLNSKGYNYAVRKDGADCIGCAFCGISCPDGCITVYKKE